MNKYEIEYASDIIKHHNGCMWCPLDCTECDFNKAINLMDTIFNEYPTLKEKATPKEG